MISNIGLNRHEVTAHYSNIVMVNGEDKSRFNRGVNQPHEVSFALNSTFINATQAQERKY